MPGQERYSAAELKRVGGLEALLNSDKPPAVRGLERLARGQNTAKSDIPTEHEEQAAFMDWAKGDQGWLPLEMRDLLYATPNGGHRGKKAAAEMKAEGQLSGVPDITFAWSRLGYNALYIEMKRTKGGRLSDNQKRVIASLRWAGNLVVVCKGCEQAKKTLMGYMIGNGKEFEAHEG